MKKELYIHIGMHKTGSTYIQKKFAENRELLGELNILYPRIGAEYLFGHHNLAWLWNPQQKIKNAPDLSVRKLVRSLKQSPTTKIILSSEAFAGTERIRDLRDAFHEFTTRIVMYVRHPCRAFYPRWQTIVKNGSTLSIQDFYARTVNDPFRFDFRDIALAWGAVFGKDAVKTVVYDNLVETGQDIACYFLENLVGVKPCKSFVSKPAERVNPSLPVAASEVIRCLNLLDEDNQHKLGAKFRTLLRSGSLSAEITQHLESINRDGTELLDLKQLHEISSQIERGFIDSECTVINPHSRHKLFRDLKAEQKKILVVKPSCVEQKIDLKSLFLRLIS